MRVRAPRAGERIALVAPSGPVLPAERIQRAVETVQELGFVPEVMPHAHCVQGHLAGSDAQRAADFNAALNREDIAAVWCLRGGAGALRLLPLIDFAALRRHPKPVLGYSDATALHAGIGVEAGVVSFLGPIAIDCTGSAGRAALMRCWSPQPLGEISLTGERCVTVCRGAARGRLIGGNLTVLARTLATPWEPDFRGAILVIEDVSEPPYRIDNMLTQLRLTGRLQRVAGVAFGQFSGTEPLTPEVQGALDAVLEERCADLGVPVMRGLSTGHAGEQVTLPLGLEAEMNADAGTLIVPTSAVE